MQLKIRLLGILMIAVFVVQAQDSSLNPCGTADGRVQWLKDYQKAPGAFPKSSTILYVPVTVHVVAETNGIGYFQKMGVLDAFCTLNKDFEPAGIQFFIEGNIRQHANSTWYNHNFQQGYQMMIQKNVPNTINCYIVESPAGNCGYSMYGVGIALAKSCTGPASHTWAHEIGHFLSLPHPFNGWEGESHDYNQPAPAYIGGELVERVDGQNCSFAGDGFCDTPADYLNYRWSCNEQGASNATQKDPTGAEFKSDGTFFMSYSLDACANRFSEEQIEAMRANVLTEKANMLYNQTPPQPIDPTDFTVISPLEDDTVFTFQQVTFEWEPVEYADGYFLDVTVLANFQAVLFRYEVQGTSFTTNDLKKNRTYYWRVRPYNRYFACKVFTDVHSFKTGDVETLTATYESKIIGDLNVFPNPATRGSVVSIDFEAKQPATFELSLKNLAGQAVYYQRKDLPSGYHSLELPTLDLPAGLYFIQLKTEEGMVGRKLVIGR